MISTNRVLARAAQEMLADNQALVGQVIFLDTQGHTVKPHSSPFIVPVRRLDPLAIDGLAHEFSGIELGGFISVKPGSDPRGGGSRAPFLREDFRILNGRQTVGSDKGIPAFQPQPLTTPYVLRRAAQEMLPNNQALAGQVVFLDTMGRTVKPHNSPFIVPVRRLHPLAIDSLVLEFIGVELGGFVCLKTAPDPRGGGSRAPFLVEQFRILNGRQTVGCGDSPFAPQPQPPATSSAS